MGSCGTAAFRGEPVTVVDIGTDPLWADYKALALPLGLVACWSSPIRSGHGKILGTFAFYFRERRGPSELERNIVATCVHLCAIAMERHSRVLEDRRLAFSDALTGLGNRAKFNAAMSELPVDGREAWGLLLVDIDNLKVINDSFGHHSGDELIQSVASRLAAMLAPDRAYRLGGDEFAVIVRSQDTPGGIDAVAAHILEALAGPAECGGHAIVPRVTIGGAVLSQGDRDAQTVRQNADIALYDAKEKQRGRYFRYTPGLGTSITRRSRLIREVDEALGDDRIQAYYQPIVRLDTQEIVGVEALCRLQLRGGAIIAAADFGAATSDVQVASGLTQRMLSRVAADIRLWLDLGIPVQHVGINVSAADLVYGKLGAQFTRASEDANLPLEHFILEVNESAIVGQADQLIAREIKALRAKGLRVALDDFGTGYASLTHLLTVPVDIIKIDSSFMNRVAPADINVAIVEGLIGIARKIGITVVAEGVETGAQADLLRALGCSLAQGYFYSRPLDRDATTDLLIRLAQQPPSGLRGVFPQQSAFSFIGTEGAPDLVRIHGRGRGRRVA